MARRVELVGCMVTKGTIMDLELGSVEEEMEEESVGIFMNIDIFVHMVE